MPTVSHTTTSAVKATKPKLNKKTSSSNPKKKKVVSSKKVKSASESVLVDAPPKESVAPPLENTVEAQILRISQKIAGLRSEVSGLNGEFRTLCKFYARERREMVRLAKKGGRRQGNAKPSGFAKPGYISPELCNFLGKPNGTEMARTDVTKYLTTYIKDHNLQNQANKKEILCDKALKGLLQPDKDDIITYFNLQSYMKRHYEVPCSVVG